MLQIDFCATIYYEKIFNFFQKYISDDPKMKNIYPLEVYCKNRLTIITKKHKDVTKNFSYLNDLKIIINV